MQKIKLVLAFRREMFRIGLSKILADEPDLEILSICCSGNECIERTMELRPDVILMGMETQDCIKSIEHISRNLPKTRIIVITLSLDEDAFFSSLQAGARAYLSGETSVRDLVSDINRVYSGEVIITPPMATRLIEEFAVIPQRANLNKLEYQTTLSKRELEVLNLVAKGKGNKEIADILIVSLNTIKTHLGNILEKLQVHTRQQAAALALEKGIVSLPSETGDAH